MREEGREGGREGASEGGRERANEGGSERGREGETSELQPPPLKYFGAEPSQIFHECEFFYLR